MKESEKNKFSLVHVFISNVLVLLFLLIFLRGFLIIKLFVSQNKEVPRIVPLVLFISLIIIFSLMSYSRAHLRKLINQTKIKEK